MRILAIILLCIFASKCSEHRPSEYASTKVYVLQENKWKETWQHKVLVSDFSHHDELWNDWDNSKELRDTMLLALFEDNFMSPVRVRICLDREFSEVVVRPSNLGIVAEKLDKHTIEFVLPSYDTRKVSVEFDGNRQENIFVIGSREDNNKPSLDDPDVLYFGAGEHDVGSLFLGHNQCLYVDFGAILNASIQVAGDNVRIAGNGIITGKKIKHWGNAEYACGVMLCSVSHPDGGMMQNFILENVTFIDSPSWTVYLNKVKGARIDNINIINWVLNGDGVDVVCCEDVLIKDCLFRCYDDCITLKVNHGKQQDCKNIEIDGCIIWEDIARGIVVGPEAGNSNLSPGRIYNVNIHDSVFLEHRGSSEEDNVRAALSICQWKHPTWLDGQATTISNIRCKNLYFDNISSDGTYIYIWQMPNQSASSHIRDVYFDNIYVNNTNNVINPVFQAITNENHIENMVIDNFVISGTKVLAPNKDFTCSGNIKGLSFK